ncbi:hypothetical protein [Ruminococcus sp. Marseille-P6503]|nr:hypothetical protein [Ruminococcus sp. Marseille-P6503]
MLRVKLAQMLPDAELRFVENSGHEVNADAPERLAELAEGFYAKNSADCK